MSKLIPVKFLKPWRGYSAGETAGFSAEQVKALTDSETAVLVTVDAKAAQAKAAPAAKAAAPVTPVAAEAPSDSGAEDEKP